LIEEDERVRLEREDRRVSEPVRESETVRGSLLESLAGNEP
jgi:hypothetical protein